MQRHRVLDHIYKDAGQLQGELAMQLCVLQSIGEHQHDLNDSAGTIPATQVFYEYVL